MSRIPAIVQQWTQTSFRGGGGMGGEPNKWPPHSGHMENRLQRQALVPEGKEGAERSIGPAPGRDKNAQGQSRLLIAAASTKDGPRQPPAPARTIAAPPSLTQRAAISLRTGSWHRPARADAARKGSHVSRNGASLSSRSVTVTIRPGHDTGGAAARASGPHAQGARATAERLAETCLSSVWKDKRAPDDNVRRSPGPPGPHGAPSPRARLWCAVHEQPGFPSCPRRRPGRERS